MMSETSFLTLTTTLPDIWAQIVGMGLAETTAYIYKNQECEAKILTAHKT